MRYFTGCFPALIIFLFSFSFIFFGGGTGGGYPSIEDASEI